MIIRCLAFLLTFSLYAQPNFKTVFETGNGNTSATYQETIDFFKRLDAAYPAVSMQRMGLTDSGEPLHIVIYNSEPEFDFEKIRKNKAVVLVNNGIHAGESDGIDATMMLFRDLASGKVKPPKNTVIIAIPVYNIGGALNRNPNSRVNQNGPEEYGFRGNARNYDLNRDFMKADTKNTRSFAEIFHLTKPDIFIDNHVSNGADYQYVLTYIMTQHNRLGQNLGSYMNEKLTPEITSSLKAKKIESTPYVNAWSQTPDKGFAQFFDGPRFATGYTALFGTVGYVVETHMLKDYRKRVKVTYEFMRSAIDAADKNFMELRLQKQKDKVALAAGNSYPLLWEIDSSKAETTEFLGYEGLYKKSEATTGDRLYYDRKKPFRKTIPFYKEYKPAKRVLIPRAYVVPQGQWHVLDVLKSNKIEFKKLANDSVIDVGVYHISDFKTSPNPYEGHYPHRNTKVSESSEKVTFLKGDFIVPTNQEGVRYLLEALEPEAADSFFNWNFFDTILQQKEGYSDYVFEDSAADMLKANPELKREFDKKLAEKKFAEDPNAQLDWLYRNSPHYEKAHLRYPIYKIR